MPYVWKPTKTDGSYVQIPTKTDQADEKNVRALIGFGEVKATKTDDFLCLNPTKFSTRVACADCISAHQIDL